MSFRRYCARKETGISWLGLVPSQWEVLQIKRFATMNYGDALGSEIRADDGGILVYGSNGVIGRHDQANSKSPVLIVGRKGSYGALNWSAEAVFVIDTAYFIDYDSSYVSLRWLYWLLHAAKLDAISQDTGVPGLARELVHGMQAVRPSGEEQEAIAAFLDRETAKIDAGVKEQERLVTLLAERRQAVMSHAVTKGLDHSVALKDTRIDRLGSVPESWTIAPLRRYAVVENGMTPSRDRSDYWTGGSIPWVASTEVNQGNVTEPSELITELAVAECGTRLFPARTVLVGMVGQGRTRGMAAIMYLTAALNQNVAGVVCSEELDERYLWHQLQAQYKFLREEGRGGNQSALNCEIIGNFKIVIPPIQEQREIAAYLDSFSDKTARLIRYANQYITLLLERRTALIHAAVTGDIDIRDVVKASSPAQAVAA